MIKTHNKPLPLIDAYSQPFWDAAKKRKLVLPKCGACGTLRTYFEPWCRCGGLEFEWYELSGNATVWSHCRFHRAYFSGIEPDMPYNVALVQLAEGPKLITNIVNVEYEQIRVGMSVRAIFEDVSEAVTLIKFTPSETK